MSLYDAFENVVRLVEQEYRLYQEWLSMLSELESTLSSDGYTAPLQATKLLEEVVSQVTSAQEASMLAMLLFSKEQEKADLPSCDKPSIEHLLALYEKIELIHQKITQKHSDLDSIPRKVLKQSAKKGVQLALDSSMDLLKTMVRFPS